MIRWIAGAASLHLGLVALLFAGVAWLAPTLTPKHPDQRCLELQSESAVALPEWARLEVSQGWDFDFLSQRLRCSWSKGPDTYTRTYHLHDVGSRWTLGTIAALGLGSVVGGLVWRRNLRRSASKTRTV